MVQQTSRKHKQTEEEKIAFIQDKMFIDCNEHCTWAVVPSTSNSDETYCVAIDESGKESRPTQCTCEGYRRRSTCIHMKAVGQFYQRITRALKKQPKDEQPGHCSRCMTICRGDICGYCAA